MWELDHKEGWAPKNWCFWIVVLEKTIESLLDCKENKPVNPKEITLNIYWKNWYWSWSSKFGHARWRAYSLEKTLMLGKIKDKRRRGRQRMRWLDSITDSMDMNLSKLWEIVEDRGALHAVVHEIAKSQTWLSNWTTTANRNIEMIWLISEFVGGKQSM